MTSKGKEWTPELEVLKLGHYPGNQLRSDRACSAPVRFVFWIRPELWNRQLHSVKHSASKMPNNSAQFLLGQYASRRMKTMRTFLFVAFACGLTYICPSVTGEEIKYPSPDGRFALRITDERKVELIEKATSQVMVDLGDAWRSQVLVWSPDSKWNRIGGIQAPRLSCFDHCELSCIFFASAAIEALTAAFGESIGGIPSTTVYCAFCPSQNCQP